MGRVNRKGIPFSAWSYEMVLMPSTPHSITVYPTMKAPCVEKPIITHSRTYMIQVFF